MSFGFSIGDFIATGQLAWNVYKSCKGVPGSFKSISQEVLSLHALLSEVKEIISGQVLSSSRQANLKTIRAACHNILQDLQSLVEKYESLGTQSKRSWDRLKWASNDIAGSRARLTSNSILLTAFISTSQMMVERKLSKFLRELQDQHEWSVATAYTTESLSPDEKQTWRAIRKELEEIGITVAAFDSSKDFIMDWFKTTKSMGAFEGCALDNDRRVCSAAAAFLYTSDRVNEDEDSYMIAEDPGTPAQPFRNAVTTNRIASEVQRMGSSFSKLYRLFNFQEARFIVWDQNMEIREHGLDSNRSGMAYATTIAAITHINRLLQDMNGICSKYGLRSLGEARRADLTQLHKEISKESTPVFRLQSSSLLRKLQWAVKDQGKFAELLQQVTSFNDSLYEICPLRDTSLLNKAPPTHDESIDSNEFHT